MLTQRAQGATPNLRRQLPAVQNRQECCPASRPVEFLFERRHDSASPMPVGPELNFGFPAMQRAIPYWLQLTVFIFVSTVCADEGAKLRRLLDSEWERYLEENPVTASMMGDRRHATQWASETEEAYEESHKADRVALTQLLKLNFDDLTDADRINYRLFQRQLEAQIREHQYKLFLIPLNQRGGIQDRNDLARSMPFDTVRDYEDWIARLKSLPAQIDLTTALMRKGIATGMMHPRVIMKRIPEQIRKQIVDDPAQSLYYDAFRNFGIEISDDDRRRLRTEARDVIAGDIIPAYREFLNFFEDQYIPASFEQVGCWQRPRGKQMYADLARKFTTTDLSPDDIHQIGQREVARIRKEMDAIQKQVGFEGNFQDFLTHLRTDSKYYYKSPDDLLKAYRDCCKRIDPELPKIFYRLPKLPYEIVPIPGQMAPDTTTAYYQRPSPDGVRPGRYYVNLYRPETRPIFEIEALSLHEAVPGHHFQIALAIELDDVPEFRRFGGYTAFIEGWGLYSEKLGEELGLYKDPYSKFGQLTYEMWRAVRLVVDTGMHHLRWTRQEAIDFFKANTSKSILDIENEVDRYIAWPGQALAYKIGELKIRELRARSEERLGDEFDVRDFHSVVLKNGAVPLDVLEEQVDSWLKDAAR